MVKMVSVRWDAELSRPSGKVWSRSKGPPEGDIKLATKKKSWEACKNFT